MHRGEFAPGDELLHRSIIVLHRSIIGTEFAGQVIGLVRSAGRGAVFTDITGSAHMTGLHHFILQPDDPVATGFLLR